MLELSTHDSGDRGSINLYCASRGRLAMLGLGSCGGVAACQIIRHGCSPPPPDLASLWPDLVSSWPDPPPPVVSHRSEKGVGGERPSDAARSGAEILRHHRSQRREGETGDVVPSPITIPREDPGERPEVDGK
uniref:Uncharacterized protein n=1 Tax=Oryza sativa subsp. japonica TaxID=39947 RepID=Q6YZ92_ORYSJ|nr:hypothetical protein [Oryza sativa Japonica Group]BAD05785.1 hypothetical protein [Oryza sativa Japonica Group]